MQITDEMVTAGAIAGNVTDEKAREIIEAGLSAVMPAQVSVKPLDWTAEENGEFLAVSAVGWYHIGYPARSWNLTMPSGEVPSFGDDLKAAKAAAQADYSARSISPVDGEPTPSTHLRGDADE